MTAALTISERDELQRLRVQVRELGEELAEWRRRESASSLDPGGVYRLAARLGPMPAVARLLLRLAEASPKAVSRAALYGACARDENTLDKVVDCQICRARKALAAKAPHLPPIITVWGFGYSMPAETAAWVLALAREPAA